MPCLEISAPLTLMWLFGRLFMDIIVSVTVLVITSLLLCKNFYNYKMRKSEYGVCTMRSEEVGVEINNKAALISY